MARTVERDGMMSVLHHRFSPEQRIFNIHSRHYTSSARYLGTGEENNGEKIE
jgi:hypothetical protein